VTVCVRMRVGSELFALPVENVSEIVERGEIAPLPGSGSSVVGVRNLRAQVVPVFDLASVLGSPGGGATVLVVAECGDRRAALGVDGVVDVAALDAPVQAAELDVLNGAVLDGDSLVGILDPERLFDALARAAA
jgi:chemotaxis signal transduction protein